MEMDADKIRSTWGRILDGAVIILASLLFVISCIGLFHPPLIQAVSALAAPKPQPIYHGKEDVQAVSIACNIYQNNEDVEALLKIFEQEGVRITFFVGGSWVKKNPELTRRIAEAGHEIGNHGTTHKQHSRLNREQNTAEIQGCTDAVWEAAQVKMPLFMPPSGDFNQLTVDVAESLGYTTVLWSADTIDWRDKDAGIIRRRASERMHPGAIILTHPTAETAKAMPGILADIRAKGWEVLTISELLKR